MASNTATESLASHAVTELLENFDCQPVLFIGSGISRRYIGSPDWEGALRYALSLLPDTYPSYEYLAQKNNNDLITIGSELADHVFEWAWHEGKSHFPEEMFGTGNKSIFLKYLISERLIQDTPTDVVASKPELKDEFDALRAIRPHAIITTNYDTMLESLFSGYEAIVGKQVLRYNLNAYGEVYHIHGIVHDPATMILTKDDYLRWDYESKYFAAKLLTYFAEHPVIIFGYSITDSNVRTVLQDIGAIVADDTGLISNVLQVIFSPDLQSGAVQTEVAIPISGSQFRIRALQTRSLLEVFSSLSARHELKGVNPAMVRALAARAMKLTRTDIPNGNIEVNYSTLEGIVDSDDALPSLLGITQADDVNKSHPYTLSIVGEKLGFPGWNGADKLIQRIKREMGFDMKGSDNSYHCAIKVGRKDSSISRKYSDAAVALLARVRDDQSYDLDLR